MKKILFLSTIGLIVSLANPWTVQALAFSVSYDQVISSNNQQVQFAVKVKDKDVRVESSVGGVKSIMIKNKSGYFNYLPTQNKAIKIPEQMQRPNLTDDLPDFGGFLKRNKATVAGSETVQGHNTDIYQFVGPGGAETKVWLWKEKQFPLKIEVKEASHVATIDLTNIQFDPATDETTFQLPPNVKITDLQARGSSTPSKQEVVQATKKA